VARPGRGACRGAAGVRVSGHSNRPKAGVNCGAQHAAPLPGENLSFPRPRSCIRGKAGIQAGQFFAWMPNRRPNTCQTPGPAQGAGPGVLLEVSLLAPSDLHGHACLTACGQVNVCGLGAIQRSQNCILSSCGSFRTSGIVQKWASPVCTRKTRQRPSSDIPDICSRKPLS
jgi:hypothetical protein